MSGLEQNLMWGKAKSWGCAAWTEEDLGSLMTKLEAKAAD